MLNHPVETLKKFVNQPSGSHDVQDVAAVAELFRAEFEELGFTVKVHPGIQYGPALECTIGSGSRTLMLMGHMDTVFSRDIYVPFHDNGDGTALGSGINDMKGGIVIMLYALKEALPQIDLSKYAIRVILNADEETGSSESYDLILESARSSFAALSFEPSSDPPRLTCARKGVTDVVISCQGIAGHAGAQYKSCASAIENLCAQITKLYTLRDDEHDISFNAGVISGGTAENVVASSACCKCEFRYFDEAFKPLLMEKIVQLCAEEPVPGCKTTVTFGVSHPAIDINEKSQALVDLAVAIAAGQGRTLHHEKVGGAGDIAIAGLAGIGVLDGLGMTGGNMHTTKEYGVISTMPRQIELAAKLMVQICR